MPTFEPKMLFDTSAHRGGIYLLVFGSVPPDKARRKGDCEEILKNLSRFPKTTGLTGKINLFCLLNKYELLILLCLSRLIRIR